MVADPTGISEAVSATSAVVSMTGNAPQTPSTRSKDPTRASSALEDRSTTVDRGEVVDLASLSSPHRQTHRTGADTSFAG